MIKEVILKPIGYILTFIAKILMISAVFLYMMGEALLDNDRYE
jgi:hypothetical protein